jgi:putative flippase GtrA
VKLISKIKADKKGLLTTIIQFIKFGIVGASNTLISLAIYYALYYLGVNYIIANTIAFFISVLNAYFWNNKYVFRSNKTNHFKAILKVYVSYGITFLLGTFLLYIMVQYFGVSKVIAPIFILFVTIPINFLLNKFWAFKDNLKKES